MSGVFTGEEWEKAKGVEDDGLLVLLDTLTTFSLLQPQHSLSQALSIAPLHARLSPK